MAEDKGHTKKSETMQKNSQSDDGGNTQGLGKRSGIPVLALVALLGVGGLGYFSYLQKQETLALEKSLAEVSNQLKGADNKIAKLDQSQTESTSENAAKVEALIKDLQAQNNRLTQISGKQDWKVHEARYLAVIAMQRLQAFNDVGSATQLLLSADSRLQDMADPRTMSTREAIAKDLTSLRSAEKPDIEGIWAKLNALVKQFDTLTFYDLQTPENSPLAKSETKASEVAAEQATETSKTEVEKPSWRQGLDSSLEKLKTLVVIKDYNESNFNLALTNKEQKYLMASLQLLVEQAKWGCLNQNSDVYQQSLASLKSWVEEYFVDNSAKSQMIASIDELAGESVSFVPPDISSSLVAIDNLIANASVTPITGDIGL